MLKRLAQYGADWLPRRRIALAAAALACLLALAAVTALLVGRSNQHSPTSSTASPATGSASSPSGSKNPGAGGGAVAGPPRTSDPVAFAKAAAAMLWTYDTRATSHEQQLAGMQAWMTDEDQYGDWTSVSAQIPDPTLWSRMSDQKQHATAAVAEGHYPAAFKQALAEHPSEITKAYIYAVTVTGKQTIAWARGGGGAEERSVTLAVQCRPSAACSLVAIAPAVAP
ncbi:hypothetical protein J7I94_02120 [Streptomyces sp. ISL-12]|uniref:hypothetical protein n=1 Tax=Streptomyces sp. ISL-12 TaxID=2819177 RepID=UPI001BE88AD4|nr:hypothetical protein [Streptomyces sp. ISL-12]MBT2409367.1 hypothetical protein [Streptomyces sp. ISL-12]